MRPETAAVRTLAAKLVTHLTAIPMAWLFAPVTFDSLRARSRTARAIRYPLRGDAKALSGHTLFESERNSFRGGAREHAR